jgi:mono/diheme cytochrome c family protein
MAYRLLESITHQEGWRASMLLTMFLIMSIFFLGKGASVAIAAESTSKPSPAQEPVNRGRYLVDNVAMCIQCHTPRDENGQLLLNSYLQGAPVPVKAPPNAKNWALRAPAIAGLPGYHKKQALRLLTQGITADGRTPNPPMPPFRFSRTDAEAIATYLESLR